jgi:hypothetical protein
MSNTKANAVTDATKSSSTAPSRPFTPDAHVGRLIQRKCDCGGTCSACAEAPKKIQRQTYPGYGQSSYDPYGLYSPYMDLDVDGGVPLDPDTMQFMETRFGTGFGDVRLHTGPDAEEQARLIGAQAFTVGNHIYFATSKFMSGTDATIELLTHELAHVMQQRSSVAPKLEDGAVEISSPGDPYEQEADRAAADVAAGRKPSLALSPGPRIQRKGEGLKGTERIVPVDEQFVVPREKGLGAGAEYRRFIKEGRLKTIAKWDRPGTSTLRNTWKRRSGWEGTDKDFESQFTVKSKSTGKDNVCELDHIVELQVGGGNNMENLQLLEKDNNAGSGRRIYQFTEDLRKAKPDKYGGEKVLMFKTDPPIVEAPVEDECQKRESQIKGKGEKTGTWIKLTFGKTEVELPLPPTTISANVYKVDNRYWQVVAGFRCLELTWPGGGNGSLDGEFASGAVNFLKDKKKKAVTLSIEKNVVNLNSDNRVKELLFPFLSEAKLNMELVDTSLAGKGSFNPSIPVLNKADVLINVENGLFSGSLVLTNAEKINLPIPGVENVKPKIEATIREKQFSAAGSLTFDVGTYASVSLVATGDEKKGFAAKGKINFHIPGLDSAEGSVKYEDEKLSGQIKIGKDKFKAIQGIKSANLTVDIDDKELKGHGEVVLGVPGVKKGTLDFGVKDKDYSVTGAVSLSIPGLKSSDIILTYADGDFTGMGKLGFDIPGLKDMSADMEIKYAKGGITGHAAVDYTKGKFGGTITADIDENGKLSGGGELRYEVMKDVVAFAGVDIQKDGKTKISGGLRIPEQVEVFPRQQLDRPIIPEKRLQFPIPGLAIPIGTTSVGLVAEVTFGVKATGYIGPAVIKNAQLKATIDPSKEDWGFEITGGGLLDIPMFGGIAVTVTGGLGLSLGIAVAKGYIGLTGTLGLEGGLSAKIAVTYQAGQFSIDALAEARLNPSLTFNVSAGVEVYVNLFFTEMKVYEKPWPLADVKWGSDLALIARMPMKYVMGQPFTPSLSDLEVIVPEIDAKKAVEDILGSK